MKQVVLARALNAAPVATDFALVDAPDPTLPQGGLLVRTLALSLDPYVGSTLRGRHMGHPAAAPGDVPPGLAVAEIVESGAPGFAPGDLVLAETGWRERAAVATAGVTRVDPLPGVPLSAYVGVLGMPGLTAWAGAVRLGEARDGDVVLVSAAAGPVGGTFGQIARLRGAKRVVGIAGGAAKCALVTGTYGFDACVDYTQPGWEDAVARETGGAVSLYIENVGTKTLNVALANLAIGGRIVLCGLAGHYHADGPPAQMPIGAIVGKRARVSGLVVYDFYPETPAFLAEVGPWVADGRLTFAEDRAAGLAGAPVLMERLMAGQNVGKAVVHLADPTP